MDSSTWRFLQIWRHFVGLRMCLLWLVRSMSVIHKKGNGNFQTVKEMKKRYSISIHSCKKLDSILCLFFQSTSCCCCPFIDKEFLNLFKFKQHLFCSLEVFCHIITFCKMRLSKHNFCVGESLEYDELGPQT